MIPEVDKTQKGDIRVEISSNQKYNTTSSTKIFNHVTTYKNAPNFFQVDAMEKIKTCIGTNYFARIYPKKETATVEPMTNHINCKNYRKILGYRDLINMDEPVRTNLMCNKLGRLSHQG